MPDELQPMRAAIARAERAARRTPGDPALARAVGRLRSEYQEAVLAKHIREAVARAPRLTKEQRDRLAVLLHSDVAASGAA